ncbi:MAG: hypothetical protein E7411_04310 [Ruminococcaceae bacterium]|nr:hypothetical protein [Oscillospiraceae bacterium]
MTMVYFIPDRFRISKMREIVHSIDKKHSSQLPRLPMYSKTIYKRRRN